jgi:alpha-tubulin suppressor-like RCC1 family protein
MQLHPPGAHRVRIATGMLAAVMSLLLTGCGSTGGSGQSNTRCGTTAAHPCAPGQSGGIAGTVWNWGTQRNGPLGNGVYTATSMRTYDMIAIAAATGVPLVGGDAGSYALATKGFVESWGHDSLDTGNLEKDVIAIAGGGDAGYALKSDGTVWAWGDNSSGQLGDGTTNDSGTTPNDMGVFTAMQVEGINSATAVAGGGTTGYALKSDGTVWAWGDNSSGQLGDGTKNDSAVPVQVKNLAGVTAVAGGGAAGYALKSDGTVWAWGSNRVGNLGDGTKNDSTVPVQVSGLSGVTAIAAGFALKSDGTVREWGGGQFQDSLVPVQVQNLSGVTAIAGDGDTGFALKPDGTVWAWGSNTWGQLGDGTTNDSSVPVQVKGLAGVTAIAIGAQQGFALSSK